MSKFLKIFNTIQFGLVLVLLVFIPLYPKLPLLNVGGTYVAIRIEDILIGVVIFIWGIGNLSRLRGYFKETIFQSFLLFWTVTFLSLISALIITYFVVPNIGFLHWARRVEYMMLFVVAATTIYSTRQLKLLIYTILFTTVAIVIYGFGQVYFDFPVISTSNKEFSKGLILMLTNGARVSSTFAGHYDLAVYLSMVLILLSSLIFTFKKIYSKIIILVIAGISLVLLGMTAARVSFLATFLGMALVFWLHKKKLLVVGLVVIAIALMATIPDLRHRFVATITVNLMGGGGPKYNPPPGKITVFTNLSSYSESSKAALLQQALIESTSSSRSSIPADAAFGEPINPTELGVYRSLGIRYNVEWPRAINAFFKNPFLGTGYSSISLATDNDLLRSLGETGLMGTISLVLIFFVIIKKLLKYIKERDELVRSLETGLLSVILMVLFSGLFIDVLEASKIAEIFWLLLGIGWSVMVHFPRKDNI